MKPAISGILTIAALVLAAVALLVALSRGGGGAVAEEPYEVAVAMGRLQRYAEKLHFAGAAKNWPLAEFYRAEIQETAEEVARANVVDEGVAVSAFMRSMFLPNLAPVEEAVRMRNAEQFSAAYEKMLLSCNACHQTTQHPYLKIVVPRQPTYENQDYRP